MFLSNTLAAVPDTLQPTYYIVGTDGNIYVNQAVPVSGSSIPYTYLGYVPLGPVPA